MYEGLWLRGFEGGWGCALPRGLAHFEGAAWTLPVVSSSPGALGGTRRPHVPPLQTTRPHSLPYRKQYGVVCTWGLSQLREQEVIKLARRCAEEPLDAEEVEVDQARPV